LFAKLRDFVTGRGKSLDLFPQETLYRLDKRIEQTFEVELKLEEHGEYVYRLRIRHETPPQPWKNQVVEESLFLNGNSLFEANAQEVRLHGDRQTGPSITITLPAASQLSGISRVHEGDDNKELVAFRRAFENTLVLQLNPSLVSAVSEGKQSVKVPKPDCSDFTEWLRDMKWGDTTIKRRAEESLSGGTLPGFLSFQLTTFKNSTILECLFESSPKLLKFRLDELSSGQIALIILEVAIAASTECGGTLLLDEPSNFLGLTEIQPLLIRLEDAALEGRFQVVLTAHHPIAVDLLAAGHGLWLEREPNGPAQVHRVHMTDAAMDDQSAIRVSDLIARGWVSALGISRPAAAPETGTAAVV